MGAWTLEQARERLQIWFDAEAAIATGQSYQIGSRRLDRADLGEVREQMKFWKKEVERLEAVEARGAARRSFRIVPRDI